jgi:hypothetical protein
MILKSKIVFVPLLTLYGIIISYIMFGEIYLIYFRCRLEILYNLNYISTTFGDTKLKRITSEGTGIKKAEYHCPKESTFFRWNFDQCSAMTQQ